MKSSHMVSKTDPKQGLKAGGEDLEALKEAPKLFVIGNEISFLIWGHIFEL